MKILECSSSLTTKVSVSHKDVWLFSNRVIVQAIQNLIHKTPLGLIAWLPLPFRVSGEGFNAQMQRLWRQGLPPKVREALVTVDG